MEIVSDVLPEAKHLDWETVSRMDWMEHNICGASPIYAALGNLKPRQYSKNVYTAEYI